MPSPSRRTTSAALQCVFRPTMPYTTWTPARSSMRAQVMLFCSSLRALSSTSAVTCLPFCAARASAEMIGLAPLVRYRVCLMARTCGSSAARSMKSTTHPNDSYGRWTRTSCERITSNTSRPCPNGGATRGTRGSSFSAGNPSSRWRAMSAVTSTGPGTRYTSRASRSCASVSIPTNVSSPSLPQALFDHLEQVLGVLLLDREVGVAGDAEHGVAHHAEPAEQLAQVARDDVLQQDKPHPPLAVGRHDHHAVEHGGDLDDGEVAPRLPPVPALDDQGDVEALVVDVWKRVSRVDGERCEDGGDAGAEQGVHVPPLGVGQVVEPHALHAACSEAGKDLVVEDAVLLRHELVGATVDRCQLLGRGHTVGPVVLRLHPGVHLLLQPRHPDLEELVQVGAEDRQELEPFEPRVRGVGRLLEHPCVELQPRQLAVEVVVRRKRGRDAIGHGQLRPFGRDHTRSRSLRNARSNKAAFRLASSSSIDGSRAAAAWTRTQPSPIRERTRSITWPCVRSRPSATRRIPASRRTRRRSPRSRRAKLGCDFLGNARR